MAISGLQVINIGLENESAGSDSLYTAFHKIKDNFELLSTNGSPYSTFTGNTGISTEANAITGTIDIINTGVTSITAGTGVVINQSTGAVTISATGGGGGGGGLNSVGLIPISTGRLTVLSSPLVADGNMTIDLASSGVSPGTYTYPTMTVDQFGRTTAISSGASVGTVTSISVTPGTGIQVTGSPITTSGTINVTNTGVTKIKAGSGISISSGNGEVTITAVAGGGSVTSVALQSNSLVITGTTITTSGTFGVDLPANVIVTGNLNAGNIITLGNANVGNLFASGLVQVTGNLTAGNLRGIFANGTSNIQIPAASGNINFSAIGNANVVVITGTGIVANNANVTGNLLVNGNLYVDGTTFNTNVTTLNVVDPIIELGGGPNGAPLLADDNKDRGALLHYYSGGVVRDAFMGWDDSNVEFAFGSNVSVTGEVVGFNAFGNVRANFFLGNGSQLTGLNTNSISNGTSNVTIASSGGPVTVGVAGNASILTVTGTGANIAGTANVTGNANVGNIGGTGAVFTTLGGSLTTAAQANITSVGTLTGLVVGNGTANVTFVSGGANGALTATGNIYAANANLGNLAIANFFSGDGYLLSNLTIGAGSSIVNGNSNVSVAPNANVTIGVAGNAAIITVTGTGANIAGYANISGNLSVTGNVNTSTAANVTLGSNANVHITGGSSGNVLITDGSGGLSWGTASGVGLGNVNVWTKNQSVTPFTLTDAATITVDASQSNNFKVTLGGNRTLANPTNLTDGMVLNFLIRQDGTGGRTLAYDTKYKWGLGGAAAAPAVSTTIGAVDLISAVYDSTSDTLRCAMIQTVTTIAGIANGTSNVNIATSNGNVTVGVAGNAAIATFTGTGANIAGTANITGNLTAGNVAATTYTGTTVNVTGQLISTVATSTAPLVITSTTLVPNLYVAHSNVAEFASITTGSSGNYYVTFANAITGNIAQIGNAAILANLSTGILYATKFSGDGSGLANVGYINIPQNSQSAAYTTVASDVGKHIYHPSADTAARTITIDSNANVPYTIGTAITFINDDSAGVMTIAINADVMRLAGAGTTGSRTLAANGIATAVKMTSTSWIISGTGLT
jgi:hypothetical protein